MLSVDVVAANQRRDRLPLNFVFSLRRLPKGSENSEKDKESVCFYYGYLNFIVGMKLPKYDLCYNTRDLIKSLAENTNDRNHYLSFFYY